MSFTGSRPSFKGVRYTPQSADPSNPLEGQLFYSDGTARPEGLWVYKNGAWTEAGSTPNTNVNYISNFGAEADTSGWATYADAAAVEPVDGTGGSPNVTLTRTTTASELIYGEGTFKLAKDAANRQGEGVSYDFVVQRADYEASNMLNISFNYRTSANYVTNDISVFVYDKDGAALVPVRNDNSSGNGAQILGAVDASKFTASFYTTQDNNDYRLIFHVASTNATAYDFFFDNVSVSPQITVPGAIITDWQSYTPSFIGTTNGSSWSNSTVTGKYRRVGENMELQLAVTFAGAPATGTGSFQFQLPTGYTIDTTKLAITTSEIPALGTANLLDSGTNYRTGTAVYVSTNGGGIAVNIDAASGTTSPTVPITIANGDKLAVEAFVPITGWTSGASLSTTETLMMSAKASMYRVTSAQAIASTSPTKVQFNATSFDNLGWWDSVNYRYVVKRPGKYQVSFGILFNSFTSGEYAYGLIYKNGSLVKQFRTATGITDPQIGGSAIVDLAANDYIEIFADSTSDASYSISNGVEVTYLDIAVIPDFSTFSVYGQYELKTASSNTKTPSATSHYHSLTNNSISLTPGTWRLFGNASFSASGGSAGFTSCYAGWYAANGADSGVQPSLLSTVVTVNSATTTGTDSGISGVSTGSSDTFINARDVIVTATSNVTIYLVTFSQQATSANARVTVYANAERLR